MEKLLGGGLRLAAWLPLLAATGILAACNGQDEQAAGVEDGATQAVDVWSFDRRERDSEIPSMADRLPADASRTILIPSTTLFPGNAWIDPSVENPVSGDPQAIANGERHFNAFNCSGCHAPLGGGGMGPPLSDNTWIYGGEPSQMFLTIMHGRPAGMPAFGSMLPEQTVWEIVAYIETLNDIENYAQELDFEERSPPANRPDAGGESTGEDAAATRGGTG